jgi:hypothetical protein
VAANKSVGLTPRNALGGGFDIAVGLMRWRAIDAPPKVKFGSIMRSDGIYAEASMQYPTMRFEAL